MRTLIRGGHVVDPSQGLDAPRDVVIDEDRITALVSPSSKIDGTGGIKTDRVIDAQGQVLMAGGIDLHTHIGGGKVTLARMLMSDQPTETVRSCLPTAESVGNRYLRMGYTSCFEPAVIPCNARSAHAEMADCPGIDTGGYCLLGNDDLLLRMLRDGVSQSLINDYVGWMIMATKCVAVKVVNPGGINAFKFNERRFDVDTPHPHYGVTPSAIIRVLCRAVHELGVPHPLHVHCSNLGVPGNIESTLATIRAADGLPIHLTHVQFHSYGDEGALGMSSAAEQLVAAMDRHPNVTIDVGQIMFGQTVTISADTMHQFENHRHAKPRRSALLDVECEAGCGVVPFRYQRRRYVHSLQWAIGLELFLMVEDPRRVFLTTDHPNGASFETYPHLIALLMDRSLRDTALAEIHDQAASASQLRGLDREYTLSEIATMTRWAPGKILGLHDQGHLREGAVADVVAYRTDASVESMFRSPAWVIRRGRQAVGPDAGKSPELPTRTHTIDLTLDQQNLKQIRDRYGLPNTGPMDRTWISTDEMSERLGCDPTVRAAEPRQR